MNNTMQSITFGGGCFWGVEAYFKRIKGVQETCVGYANSNVSDPSYEAVCTGRTDAVEAVKIHYDEHIISLETLIAQLFSIINPFTPNRQGNDVGTQYRAGIYTSDEKSLRSAQKWVDDFAAGLPEKKVVVEVLTEENFYPAEIYHQNYLEKNPHGYCHIDINSLPAHLRKL